MGKKDYNSTLLKWAQSLLLNDSAQNLKTLADGNALYQILKQIDPIYFTQHLITPELCSNHTDYKILNIRLNQRCIPDINAYGESEFDDMVGKFLQLILGCAVNCENKQVYIQKILQMEKSCQEVIMDAITQLDLKEQQPTPILSPIGDTQSTQVKHLEQEVFRLKIDKEESEGRCQEMLDKLTLINEEKCNLLIENQNLYRNATQGPNSAYKSLSRLGASIDNLTVPSSDEENEIYKSQKYDSMAKQINSLREDVYRLENVRDDCEIQLNLVKKENLELMKKNEDLLVSSSQAHKYKDELDVLRHLAEKIPKYESTIDTYKKKLDALSFTNRVDILEEKNAELNKNLAERDDDKRKLSTLKNELDSLKFKHREILNLQEFEKQRLEKVMVEKIDLQDNFSKIETHTQNLMAEIKKLKDENDYLNLCLGKDTVSNSLSNSTEPSPIERIELSDIVTNGANKTPLNDNSVLEFKREILKVKAEKDEMEKFYSSHLEKAKKIIDILEDKKQPNGSSSQDDKDAIIKELTDENDKLKTSQEIITMAWNNLAMRMYKQNMNENFSSSLWSHNSFLNHQRAILSLKYKRP
ncbi:protein Hook homolog 3-like isoform X2 [Gordionus sp. m RMFG-2023]|uniref:protein Hook homolog 3-like isoform X2 n=1 Tax=Gordionus sp. m RMFG-2023 TaxID=3053472 RepID=UPI0031FBE188